MIIIMLILITIYMLKDIYVIAHNSSYDEKLKELQGEDDPEVPVWVPLFIVLVSLIPIINIIAFITFLVVELYILIKRDIKNKKI